MVKLPFQKTKLGLLVSAAVAAFSMPAAAQECEVDAQGNLVDPECEVDMVEEVYVTATRRATTATSIPMNIDAIGEAELRERQIVDLKSLIRDSVAISAPENSARFADSVTVRGLNVSPVNQHNIEYFIRSTLAYYLDETPLPNIGYRIKDINRVETLMGPQGTLYGSGSLGGTVRYITNQPDFEEQQFSLNVGMYQTQGGGLSSDTDFVMNLPLGEDLALRASLAYLDEAGYTDRVFAPRDKLEDPTWTKGAGSPGNPANIADITEEDHDWQKVMTGKVALAWQATDDLKLTLTHAAQDQEANGTGGTALYASSQPNAWEIQYGLDIGVAHNREYADRTFSMTSLDLDWDLGFAMLESNTSVFKDTREGAADYPQAYTFYGSWGLPELTYGANPTSVPYMLFDNTYEGLSHETRLVSTIDGPISYIVGLYHTNQKRSLWFGEIFGGLDEAFDGSTWWAYIDRDAVGGLPDQGYGENINSDYTETAFFGEVTWDVTERFHITVGARVFDYEDIAAPEVVDYAFGLVDHRGTNVASDTQSFFKFNAHLDLTDDLLMYYTQSQGYRRGGINGFKDQNGLMVSDDAQVYEPDSIDNRELGIKGYIADDALRLQMAIYQMDWNNTQTYYSQSVNGFPVNGTANGPDAETEGVEFALQWTITEGLKVNFATSRSIGKWAETKELCLYTDGSSCRTWYEGGQLGGTALWNHSFGVSYTTELLAGVGMSASLRGNYRGEVQSDRADDPNEARNIFKYPEMTRFNANISFYKDDWAVSGWVTNLTNERELVSYQRVDYIGYRDIYSMPRTAGITLSYDF